MNRTLTLAALLTTFMVSASGCSSQKPQQDAEVPSSTASAATSTTAAEPAPASFHGPVFMICNDEDTGPTIEKLNLETKQFTMIASYPVGRCPISPGNYNPSDVPIENVLSNGGSFRMQALRTAFSPDYRKLVVRLESDNTVTYYNLDTRSLVNVTKTLTPAGGDFDAEPRHEDASFTQDGLFMFHDAVADDYKYLDTSSMKVVKNTKEPEQPDFLKWVAAPGGQFYKTCGGWWVVDGARYLHMLDHEQYGGTSWLDMSAIPADAPPTCAHQVGEIRLTPDADVPYESAIADPTGQTVLFTMTGKTGERRLYRADPQHPDNPVLIDLPAGALGYAGNHVNARPIAWE